MPPKTAKKKPQKKTTNAAHSNGHAKRRARPSEPADKTPMHERGVPASPQVLKEEIPIHGFDPWIMRIQEELDLLRPKPLRKVSAGCASVEVRVSDSSLWLVGHWNGAYVALRPAYVPGGGLKVVAREEDGAQARYHLDTPIGAFSVRLCVPEPGLSLIRVTTTFTPCMNMRFPYWPRDVYPIDETGNPLATRGVIHAAQRDAAAGVLYLSIGAPAIATMLYFQNLTWANGYAQTTETELQRTVGGTWPHLGYQPPASSDHAMTAGEEEEWSDFFVRFCEETPVAEGDRGRVFLEGLADVYRHLPPPTTTYRDWPQKARDTLESLESPKCWVRYMGYDYLRPYVNGQEPDSMVQTVLLPRLSRYAKWADEELPVINRIREGLDFFYDPKSQAVRRYLPDFSGEEDINEIDSWYLYHPLMSLARIAEQGDERAKELLSKGIGFAIKAARHFNYRWPIKFSLLTLEPTEEIRKPGEPGQTDVPGLYAYLMLRARDVLGVEWYAEEAKRALQEVRGLGFEIGYQFNNVAWAAVACGRLWKETGDPYYLATAYAYLASFFHNTILWEPDYGLTRSYSMFMGVTCLHDGKYTAMFEEHESFTAFDELLRMCGDDLKPGVRLLLAEYGKFLLSRGWYYYPSELPEEILAKKPRDGEIDRALAFPLEDLYAERHLAGCVGQEIYGGAAAFELTAHSYHRVPGAPFTLFCEYFLGDIKAENKGTVVFSVFGDPRLTCRLRLIPHENLVLPPVALTAASAPKHALEYRVVENDHVEFAIRGGTAYQLTWRR